MFDVLRAYLIARKAHKGQKDRAGVAYIKHPVYVARHVKGKEAKIVALLHDVVEDTPVSLEYLSTVFDKNIIKAVKTLTRNRSMTYRDYILEVKKNKLARQVKIQDLMHNMKISRLKTVTMHDARRFQKYACALEELLKNAH